jgi:hypothetical protein
MTKLLTGRQLIAGFLAVCAIGGSILIDAWSSGNALVTEENYNAIAKKSMTRSAIDAILGPPDSIQHDEEIFKLEVIGDSRGSIVFVPIRSRCREIRIYIGKPGKQYNRPIIRVGFNTKSSADIECLEWSPTLLNKIFSFSKEKLGL